MARFDDVLSPADVVAIHAYLIDEAWRLEESGSPAQLQPPSRDAHSGPH
jgi:hypothetical protein